MATMGGIQSLRWVRERENEREERASERRARVRVRVESESESGERERERETSVCVDASAGKRSDEVWKKKREKSGKKMMTVVGQSVVGGVDRNIVSSQSKPKPKRDCVHMKTTRR